MKKIIAILMWFISLCAWHAAAGAADAVVLAQHAPVITPIKTSQLRVLVEQDGPLTVDQAMSAIDRFTTTDEAGPVQSSPPKLTGFRLISKTMRRRIVISG